MPDLIPLYLEMPGDLRIGIAITLILGLIAWRTGFFKRGGLVAWLLVGIPIYGAFDWAGYLVWILALIATEIITRHVIAAADKKNRGTLLKIEPKKFGAIFVPSALPALAALIRIVATEPANKFLAVIFFAGALTTALGDITASLLGQIYGKRTYQLITLERVRSGTRGGISVEGSVYGAVAVVLLASLTVTLIRVSGLTTRLHEIGLRDAIVLILASLLAIHIESVISGLLSQFQRKPAKGLMNFIGSTFGALLALFFTNLPEGL